MASHCVSVPQSPRSILDGYLAGLALVLKYHGWPLFLLVPVFARFSTRLLVFPTALGVFFLQVLGIF